MLAARAASVVLREVRRERSTVEKIYLDAVGRSGAQPSREEVSHARS